LWNDALIISPPTSLPSPFFSANNGSERLAAWAQDGVFFAATPMNFCPDGQRCFSTIRRLKCMGRALWGPRSTITWTGPVVADVMILPVSVGRPTWHSPGGRARRVADEGRTDAAAVMARYWLKGGKEQLFKEVLRGWDWHHPPGESLKATGCFTRLRCRPMT